MIKIPIPELADENHCLNFIIIYYINLYAWCITIIIHHSGVWHTDCFSIFRI